VNNLQAGCQHIKMLRLSNVSLTASKKEIPGFPELEELSVAMSDGSEEGSHGSCT